MWPAFSPAEIELRDRFRSFLAEALPPRGPIPEDGWIHGFDPEFSRRLGAAGFIGMTWPITYGGGGRNYVERAIVTEELLRAGAPTAAHWVGDRQIGPALLAHGTEEQKREILPQIVRGELKFCLGMSEPGAGSDLAALTTRAVEDGDAFVVDGQKVWTSFAHHADYCYLVARTDPEALRHRGISELLVDMRLPGITVRPLVDMTGEHHFNEVFFEQVRVPRENLLGELHEGWQIAVAALQNERGILYVVGMQIALAGARDKLLEFARSRGAGRDPLLRQALARLHLGTEIFRVTCQRTLTKLLRMGMPGPEASIIKLHWTELTQSMPQLGMSILGPEGLLYDTPQPGERDLSPTQWLQKGFLGQPAASIASGTSEIMRGIIAMQVLGLPRGT
jgi:alkylation response protein AidB-like acyl-CoA dehydrogenase